LTFYGIPVTGVVIAYYLIALFTISCAVMMLSFRKVMYMALSAGGVFLGVAGIYILLQADFLAFAQILIYAGAITILMLFAIMLTKHDTVEESPFTWGKALPAGIGTFGTLLFILWTIRTSSWPVAQAVPHGSNVSEIGLSLFRTYAIPFELVSLVLIVALVGTVVLARKEED